MNKGLEALQELKLRLYNPIKNDELQKNYYDVIEKDLNRLEKYDKAIAITKEKEPDISFLVRIKDLNYYNSCVWKEQELTQEEFDLLKEVLE